MLSESLAAVVGGEHVVADRDALAIASADLFEWPGAVLADLLVRPGSTEELARVLGVLHAAGRPVVPRGAGLSYTGGPVPHVPAVVIDCARLDRIEVHADDLYAVVGAGVTWERLAQAVAAFGLCAAQASPISGSHSTVGGAAAQNIPGGLDGILGLTVVLADGTVVRTGALARAGASAFQRYIGPDLTGLFLGDCGAFGIKSEVVVRLAPLGEAAFASFSFRTADDMLAALVTLRQRGLVTRAFSMDASKGKSVTDVDASQAMSVVKSVVMQAGSVGRAIKDLSQLAVDRNVLADEAGWSLHLTVEAATEAIATAQMELACAVCRTTGREISNLLPKTLRAKPYSVRGFVGPEGERWVPVHGFVPLSRARECMRALQLKLDDERAALAAAGVGVGWIISSGPAHVTIEPMFYWKDRLEPIHLHYLSERNRRRFGGGAVNPEARRLVSRLRGELAAILRAHDGAHAQLGRFYPYLPLLDAASRDLALRVKDMLDPGRRMNPGVLGYS